MLQSFFTDCTRTELPRDGSYVNSVAFVESLTKQHAKAHQTLQQTSQRKAESTTVPIPTLPFSLNLWIRPPTRRGRSPSSSDPLPPPISPGKLELELRTFAFLRLSRRPESLVSVTDATRQEEKWEQRKSRRDQTTISHYPQNHHTNNKKEGWNEWRGNKQRKRIVFSDTPERTTMMFF